MDSSATKQKYTVIEANEADLPEIVDVQFKTFRFFEPEVLSTGDDTPENQAIVLARHQAFMQSNKGSHIAKVVLSAEVDGKISQRIVAFCFFIIPDPNASEEDQVPPAARPGGVRQATWIDDPVRRAKVEAHMNAVTPVIQTVVAGRPCGWVRFMCVLPGYQGRGIGQALMDWGTRLFDEAGVAAALMASPGADRLYARYGFEEKALAAYGGDEKTAPIMCKVMWRAAGSR